MKRFSMMVAAAVLALASNVAIAQTPTSTDEARALAREPISASDAEKVTADANRHAEEMNKGKDHQSAWDATHSSSEGEKMATQGRKHAEEMNTGKDHQAAWEAARR
jgi:hypothetical protein